MEDQTPTAWLYTCGDNRYIVVALDRRTRRYLVQDAQFGMRAVDEIRRAFVDNEQAAKDIADRWYAEIKSAGVL